MGLPSPQASSMLPRDACESKPVQARAKVATSALRTQKADAGADAMSRCWYAVEVRPGMDASLVALAAVMEGLLVDELSYRMPF